MPLLNNADALYFGSQKVDRIYKGSAQVWPSVTPADIPGLVQWRDAADTHLMRRGNVAGVPGQAPAVVGQFVRLHLDHGTGDMRDPDTYALDFTSVTSTVERLAAREWHITANASGNIGQNSVVVANTGIEIDFELIPDPSSSGIGIRLDTAGGVMIDYQVSGRYVVLGVTPSERFNMVALAGWRGRLIVHSVRTIPGYHSRQGTSSRAPVLRANRLEYDGVDDVLTTTFPNLGSQCTVARAIPGVGAQILTDVTINGAWDDTVTSAAIAIYNRALTPEETARLTDYMTWRAAQ